MICGCSPLISSATEAASIHFRLSMPAVVLPLQDAVDERGGLVVAQRAREHRAHVLVRAGADGRLLLGLARGTRAAPWRPARASRSTSLAIAGPSFCTSRGPRCLNTSTASSSPSDISRMALRWMPSSLNSLPHPVLHHVGDDARLLPREVLDRPQVGLVARLAALRRRRPRRRAAARSAAGAAPARRGPARVRSRTRGAHQQQRDQQRDHRQRAVHDAALPRPRAKSAGAPPRPFVAAPRRPLGRFRS